MRTPRLLVAGLMILAVAACATTTPGWTYAPASPSLAPSADAGASAAAPSGSAAASAPASPAASASAPPASGAPSPAGPATALGLAAQNIAFDKTELSVAANVAFQIRFDNKDAGIPHNVEIKDAAGASVFKGEIFPGVAIRPYDVQPLAAGNYQFVCSVHTNMVGTLAVQ